MARLARGFRYGDYLALLAQFDDDVERMSSRAQKRYLGRRLRAIEARIRLRSRQLMARERGPGPTWDAAAMADERRTCLADLNYLLAAREAIKDTISAL